MDSIPKFNREEVVEVFMNATLFFPKTLDPVNLYDI